MHKRTAKCTWGVEWKRRQLAAEEEREVIARSFSAYGRPLEMVISFKNLGQVISATDDDWPAVVSKLARVKMFFRSMSRILSREGATPCVSGFFLRP